ncbi:MAG: SDR family oxidoreductase [Comamonas sp.]
MSNDVKQLHAVVTGSSGGIGKAICEELLAGDWHVTGVDLSPPTIEHSSFTHQSLDLSNHGQTDTVAAGLKNIDALVHAAGVLRVGALGKLDANAGQLMWKLHVDAATQLADALVPAMAERGFGRVVFIGSRVAQGLPGRGQYAATKAAVIAMARSWAVEVAPNGVTVNVVSPGATATPMLKDPARAGSAPRMPPMGRLIEPQEIASLVSYLLSPAAAAITGQNLNICGGSSLPQ